MTRPLDELNKKRSAPPDVWAKTMRWISVCGWTVVVAAIYFFGSGKPQMETFFDRKHQIYVRQIWNMRLVDYALDLVVISLILGLAGVAISLWRYQVKEEELRFNLMIMTAFSAFGIGYYLWFFGF